MRFTTVFALLTTLAIAVSATFPDAPQLDTNAKRFAAGLKTPLPPQRRNLGTPVYGTHFILFFIEYLRFLISIRC